MQAIPKRADHVFATDLPKDTSEDTLRTVFGQYGTVHWLRVFNGMGKTAALIQMGSVEEATFLVENMNGAVLHDLLPGPVTLCYSEGGGKGGRGKGKGGPLTLVRATPYGAGGGGSLALVPQSSPSSYKSRGKGFGSIVEVKKELQFEGVLPGGKWTNDDGALHIGGLPPDTTNADVYEIFAPFGAIPSGGVKAMNNPDGTCTGVAFVNYVDPNCAIEAINVLNGRTLRDGRVLAVKQKRK
mmetsp:Transcript_92317/g.214512  ORF Transcript_92317/g.214512 Transcript_92317/m.214512 type:complete len:241 (+) Transcript_92317:91-813(+)